MKSTYARVYCDCSHFYIPFAACYILIYTTTGQSETKIIRVYAAEDLDRPDITGTLFYFCQYVMENVPAASAAIPAFARTAGDIGSMPKRSSTRQPSHAKVSAYICNPGHLLFHIIIGHGRTSCFHSACQYSILRTGGCKYTSGYPSTLIRFAKAAISLFIPAFSNCISSFRSPFSSTAEITLPTPNFLCSTTSPV